MARGVNKVILLGNLGQDPELRYTGNGTAVCNLRLATSDRYKDQDGNWVERTEWHRLVAWARLAETCNEYLQKGSQIFVEGQLQTRSYDDSDGNKRWTTEIKIREMVMLGGRGGSTNNGGMAAESPAETSDSDTADDSFGPDDDLPF